MRIYLIFILIHATVNSISIHKKYCPPQEIFHTNENSTCRISYTDNFSDDYEEKSKDWIDEYLMGCFNGSSTKDFPSTMSKLRMISCTNLIHKKNLTNMSYVYRYDKKGDNYSIPRSITVRKCCPQRQRYDTEVRECVNSSENNDNIFSMLRDLSNKSIDSLSIIQGFPTCNYVLINYIISKVDGRLILYNDTYQGLISSKISKNELFLSENDACFDIGSSSDTFVVKVCGDGEFCQHHTCLKKCCLEDEARIQDRCQKISLFPNLEKRFHSEVESFVNNARYDASLSDVLKSTNYGLITGMMSCKYNKSLFPVKPSESWYFTSSGNVYVPNHKTAHNHDGYCLEMILGSSFDPDGLYLIMCSSEHVIVPDNNFTLAVDYAEPKTHASIERVTIKAIFETISCAFLLLTFFVYLSLPSLKNIHGIILMCHIGCFFFAYGSYATMIFLIIYDITAPNYYLLSQSICKVLGYSMTISFLAAFSWLNVMCFDIWWTLRRYNSVIFINSESIVRKKRFLHYSSYAWGLPLFASLLIFAFDFTKVLPFEWRPHIGTTTCWLGTQNNSIGKVVYFYGPFTILLSVNIIFFILTLRNCNKVKASISKFRSTNNQGYKATKAKIKLTFKLFIVMGISWTSETIAFFTKIYVKNFKWADNFFFVFDIINCLHGVSIFILFVVKTDVYRALVQKFSHRQVNLRLNQKNNYLRNIFKKLRSVNSTSTLITPMSGFTNTS